MWINTIYDSIYIQTMAVARSHAKQLTSNCGAPIWEDQALDIGITIELCRGWDTRTQIDN